MPQPVVAEVTYLIGKRLDARLEVLFLQDLASGTLIPEPIRPSDWARVAELVWLYRSLNLGTVDACVVAVAERMRITTIATTDRRDFSAVRPAHVGAFELLP